MRQHAPTAAATATGRGPTGDRGGRSRHSLPLGRLFGIPLEVHWTFLLLLGLVALAEWTGGIGAVGGGLLWVAALFACVVVHELAHCLVARRRKASVLGILLLPLGGVSRIAAMPSEPSDEFAIAAAGPAISFGLGATFVLIGAAAGSAIWPPTMLVGSWWARLGWVNLLLGAFNLLPALPMDGGRLLRSTLARRLPRFQATRIAATVAKVLAVGLVVAGIFYDFDFWLVLIGIFVFVAASGEEAQVRQAGWRAMQSPWSGTGRWWSAAQQWNPRQEWNPPPWPPAPNAPWAPPYGPLPPASHWSAVRESAEADADADEDEGAPAPTERG